MMIKSIYIIAISTILLICFATNGFATNSNDIENFILKQKQTAEQIKNKQQANKQENKENVSQDDNDLDKNVATNQPAPQNQQLKTCNCYALNDSSNYPENFNYHYNGNKYVRTSRINPACKCATSEQLPIGANNTMRASNNGNSTSSPFNWNINY